MAPRKRAASKTADTSTSKDSSETVAETTDSDDGAVSSEPTPLVHEDADNGAWVSPLISSAAAGQQVTFPMPQDEQLIEPPAPEVE